MQYIKLNSKGYMALSAVLVILAVVIALTLTVTYSSIGEAQSGLALYLGENDLAIVEGCVEDMMLKVRSDSTYSGTTITTPEGICQITYNVGTSRPANWDITITANINSYQRSIRIIFVRNQTGITLTSWNEI